MNLSKLRTKWVAAALILAAGFAFGFMAAPAPPPLAVLGTPLAVLAPVVAADLPAGAVIKAGVRGSFRTGDRVLCTHGMGSISRNGWDAAGSGDGWLCRPLTVKP